MAPSSYRAECDEQLVKYAKEGDKRAFDELYCRYSTLLCWYITNLIGDYEEAQNLVQEVFTSAWLQLATLRQEGFFKAWVFRIATNDAQDFLRRKSKFRWLSCERDTTRLELLECMRQSGPEDLVVKRIITAQALQRVPFKYRVCLLLDMQDQPYSLIAEQVGIQRNSVSTYIGRAALFFQKAVQCIENDILLDMERGLD